MRSSVRVALLVALAFRLALRAVFRAAITVANTNDEDPGSLRQAIEDSGPVETIVVPAGTYTLASAGHRRHRDQVAAGEVDPQAEEAETALARGRLHLAALAAALWVLVSAAAAPADQRTVIGHSVKGRPIVAISSGDTQEARLRVLVVGCIHGDETAGVRVARRMIAAAAPPHVAVWVVPTLNPDGVAAGTRGNAHGVDLNRNFPFGWRPLGGGEYSGPGALSEPESRAGYDLIRRIRPDLTIWFHQPFGLVDRSGGDAAVERRYAELIGLPLVGLRRYPGSASSWQNHTMAGSTAFVVELPAVASGGLVRRAAKSTLTLAAEYASPEVSGATVAGRAEP